jgi:hypothetical protein
MSAPIVVQGTPVASSTPQYAIPNDVVVQTKETKCNDPFFALLFYINVFAIVGVAIVYGEDAMSSASNTGIDYTGYVWGIVVISIISFFGAAAGMAVMVRQTLAD